MMSRSLYPSILTSFSEIKDNSFDFEFSFDGPSILTSFSEMKMEKKIYRVPVYGASILTSFSEIILLLSQIKDDLKLGFHTN